MIESNPGSEVGTHASIDYIGTIMEVLTDRVLAHIDDSLKVENPQAIAKARVALLDALGRAFETLSGSECTVMIGTIVEGFTSSGGFRLPGDSPQQDPAQRFRNEIGRTEKSGYRS